MNAQQLKNAILQDLFLPKDNWEEKELKEIVSKQCPISYGIVQQGNHVFMKGIDYSYYYEQED